MRKRPQASGQPFPCPSLAFELPRMTGQKMEGKSCKRGAWQWAISWQ